jgi:hypothetical protein
MRMNLLWFDVSDLPYNTITIYRLYRKRIYKSDKKLGSLKIVVVEIKNNVGSA